MILGTCWKARLANCSRDISKAFNFPTTSDKCKKSSKMFWMSLGRGMAGTTTPEGGKLTGFFDEGTFKESLRSNSILAPG
jgi:hypothetical protein